MVQDLATIEDPYKLEDGEIYDEDSGSSIGFLDVSNAIPAQISVCYRGHWYLFKIQSRTEITEEERKEIEDKVNEKPEPLSEFVKLEDDPLKDL